MAQTLDKMLEPGERVVWRDPSRLRLIWPHVIMLGLAMAVVGGSRNLAPAFWTWPWDFVLFPSILVAAAFAYFGIADRKEKREAEGIVTGSRILFRSRKEQLPRLVVPLTEVRHVALAADGTVEIVRRDGGTVQVPGLLRPERFAHAAAKAAQASTSSLPGRLHRFGPNCWVVGGLAFVIAAQLLGNTLMPGGQPDALTEIVGRALLRLVAITLALWIGAHVTCLVGLVLARLWVSAEEVRSWLNAWPEARSDWALYRWSLWKSRPYFLLAQWLWDEPMNGPVAESASNG